MISPGAVSGTNIRIKINMLLRKRSRKSQASKNRHYVTIQQRTYTSDTEGGHTETWSDITAYTNIPASIEPISAKRKEEYRTFDVDATHEIGFRGEIDNIEEDNNRITFGSRIFEIKTIENIQERDVQLQCVCLERRE